MSTVVYYDKCHDCDAAISKVPSILHRLVLSVANWITLLILYDIPQDVDIIHTKTLVCITSLSLSLSFGHENAGSCANTVC